MRTDAGAAVPAAMEPAAGSGRRRSERPRPHRARLVRISHVPDGVAPKAGMALPGTRNADEVRISHVPDGVAPKAGMALPGTRNADSGGPGLPKRSPPAT